MPLNEFWTVETDPAPLKTGTDVKSTDSKPVSDKPKIRAQSGKLDTDMRVKFEKQFDPIIPAKALFTDKVQMGEHIGKWSTLAKRYTRLGAFTLVTTTGNTSSPLTPADFNDTFWSRVIKSFLFYRGSYRIKILMTTVNDPQCMVKVQNKTDDAFGGNNLGSANGEAYTFMGVKRIVEFEIPYYSKYTMLANSFRVRDASDLPGFNYSVTSATGNSSGFLFIAAGDDWMYGWPVAPPVLRFTPP